MGWGRVTDADDAVPATDPDSGTQTRVSVIIPAYNPGPALDLCIDAVLRQDVPAEAVEVLLVDNGSDPPIDDRWGDRVRVIVESEAGSYAARNAGIRAAAGDFIAFTDADCIPHRCWLREGLRVLRSGAGVVTGPVRLFGGQPTTVTELYEFRYGFPQDRYLEESFGVTANLFVRKSLIDRHGAFDSALRSGGDREFGQRLARFGHPPSWAEAAVVDHPARRRVSELLGKARRTAAGTASLQRRSQGPLSVVLGSLLLLRPPVRALVAIIREERTVGLPTRIRLAGLVYLVRVTVSVARIRVLLGRQAPR